MNAIGPQETGLVQVYTGQGKGKTTAALGLALRASGQGLRVIIIQFMKGEGDCGEHRFVRRCPAFEIVQATDDSLWTQSRVQRRASVRSALSLARQALGGDYDVVILDEILSAVHKGLLESDTVVEMVKARRPNVEAVLTGRHATADVVELADLVTEMRSRKHPFTRGVHARRGIEY